MRVLFNCFTKTTGIKSLAKPPFCRTFVPPTFGIIPRLPTFGIICLLYCTCGPPISLPVGELLDPETEVQRVQSYGL